MRKITLIFILISTISYSQKIKRITEYKIQEDSTIKVRESFFDKKRNLIKEIEFGNYDIISKSHRNKQFIYNYNNNRKESYINCEYFVERDTCVIRSFSKYEFDKKTNTEKETMYEPDSLIRFIRISILKNKKETRITYIWDWIPVEKPDYKSAFVIKDTVFYDRYDRPLKKISYSKLSKKPKTEIFTYNKNGYKYELTGTEKDTVLNVKYTKIQKLIIKKRVKYNTNSSKDYKYSIEYY